MTEPPPSIDVSGLPPIALDARSPFWWGNTLFMVIETTTMALLMVSYLYTWRAGDVWPPPLAGAGPDARSPLPGLGVSTMNLALLLASCWPIWRADRAARRGDRIATRNGLLVVTVIGFAAIALRFYEFPTLKVHWDDNSYGSLVWTILGMHLTYVIAATLEALLTALWVILYGLDEERTLDVTLSAIYWFWMVGLWVPFYAAVYWGPRVL